MSRASQSLVLCLYAFRLFNGVSLRHVLIFVSAKVPQEADGTLDLEYFKVSFPTGLFARV